jgi:hypothetical protein
MERGVRLQSTGALIAALLFAALVPSFVVAALAQSIGVLPLAFGAALGHAVVLGLPLFFVLRSKHWVNSVSSIMGGFLVGAIPGGIFTWPLRPGTGTNSSTNGVPTVIDGIPTAAGWLGYIEFLAFLGALGALGGLFFWLTLKLSGELARAGHTAEGRVESHGRRGYRIRSVIALGAVAVALAALVFAIPIIRKDRTCHNMFRDGRSSVHSQLNVDILIAIEDWPALSRQFEEFAAAHALSFRNSSRTDPGVVHVLGLSLCNENGVNISAIDQRWVPRNLEPIVPGRGVGVGVYELRENSGWRAHARDLVAVLEAAWPGKVTFRDKDGRLMPKPTDL